MKICTKCGVEKKKSEFSTQRSRKGGLHSWCKSCMTIKTSKYQKTPRGKEVHHRYCSSDKFKKVCRIADLKRHYGITIDEYDRLFESQGGKCAICNTEDNGGKRFYVDHNHNSGIVRGLLCINCNAALGHYKDSIEIHLNAIYYLNKYRKD